MYSDDLNAQNNGPETTAENPSDAAVTETTPVAEVETAPEAPLAPVAEETPAPVAEESETDKLRKEADALLDSLASQLGNAREVLSKAEALAADDRHPDDTEPDTGDDETVAPSPEALAAAEDQELKLKQERTRSEMLKTVMATDIGEFAALMATLGLQEIVLLMEEMQEENVERDTIRKVGQIKRRFDELYTAQYELVKEVDVEDPDSIEAKEQTEELSRRFSRGLGGFNRRKAAYEEALENQKSENSKQKATLLEELKEIVHTGKVQALNRVRNIQKRWKEIGPVLAEDVENFYQSFKALLDQFYTSRKQYIELVDQDRKINLEKKQGLIQELRDLIPADAENATAEQWQDSLEKVKTLHAKWKDVGPVPQDQSEIIWEIFKTATDEYYAVRRTYFEARDGEREQNAVAKRDLLAKIQEIAAFESEKIDDWRTKTNELKDLQEKWRKIGEVPFRQINELNKSFREALDKFFDRRGGYFNELDKEHEKFLGKKQELVEKAVALKDSQDYTRTAEQFKRLQRDWKASGPDQHREARKLQKKFRKICDTFFKKHKDWIQNQETTEATNLEAKNKALADMKTLVDGAGIGTAATDLQPLIDKYLEAGPVPMKDRETLEDRFWALVEEFFKNTIADVEERENSLSELRVRLFSGRGNNTERLDREVKKLEKRIQEAHERVVQYETNIGFISPGKKGDALRQQIQEKIDQAAKERTKLEEKMKAMKKMMKEARQAAKEAKEGGKSED